MANTPQIQVVDKWDTYIIMGETLGEAAFKLLKERYEEGYWYDNWDDGNPEHQFEDIAKLIIDVEDHDAAWGFLLKRRDHEYEWVEKVKIR